MKTDEESSTAAKGRQTENELSNMSASYFLSVFNIIKIRSVDIFSRENI